MCDAPVRNETLKPLLVGVIGGAITLIIFTLRLCSGLPVGGRLMGWDDYAICVAVALGTPPTVFSVLRMFRTLLVFHQADENSEVSKNGLGKDMWTLPLSNIKNVLFVWFLVIEATLYPLTHCSTTIWEKSSTSPHSQRLKFRFLLSSCVSFHRRLSAKLFTSSSEFV